MPTWDDERLRELVVGERRRLAQDLSEVSIEQWNTASLCGEWTVEQTLAHLSAAATTTFWPWLRSMAGARFRTDVHNARRLVEHLGASPAETLERFRSAAASTAAPSKHTPAWLGEVLVHGEDIRRPLGVRPADSPESLEAATAVAEFYAARDFAVNSAHAARGLRLVASDGPFAAGSVGDPEVVGPTLSLVMAMAGRRAHLSDLSGVGLATLAQRI